MTRIVKTDGGWFAVEWRSDVRPYGWVRVSVPDAPNLAFATKEEAKNFAAAWKTFVATTWEERA